MARLALATICVLLIVCIIQYCTSQNPPASSLKAVVLMTGNSSVKGVLHFQQDPSHSLHINGEITGLTPGKHGFHVHEFGDMTGGCMSAGAHFNPSHHTHGAQDDSTRHEGDLGNIEADLHGKAIINLSDRILTLSGTNSIVGRAMVVHDKVDDLGKGGNEESKKTGNAGARLACGVIGWAN